jgi:F-type H+-transporting ATPase subunit b
VRRYFRQAILTAALCGIVVGAIHPSTSLPSTPLRDGERSRTVRTVSLSNRESPLRWNGPPVAAAILAPPEEPAESASETRELIYKTVNFLILVGALGYFLRKPAAEYFASRSAAIRKGIEEGRKALAASESELRVIEEKLSKLEQEIRAFEDAAEREAAAEAERFRRETETEAAKLLEFARARLNSATRAARQELQAFAGAEALRLAELRVRERLDAPRRERLFARYLAGLKATELASRN